jgi:hypothetical protein
MVKHSTAAGTSGGAGICIETTAASSLLWLGMLVYMVLGERDGEREGRGDERQRERGGVGGIQSGEREQERGVYSFLIKLNLFTLAFLPIVQRWQRDPQISRLSQG